MNRFLAASSRSDRRGSLRHYLTRPVRAELVYGCQRIAIESGAIYDISEGGVGVRTSQRMTVPSGAAVTIAVPQDDRVLTMAGKVATNRNGYELGICVGGGPQANPLVDMLGDRLESAAVSPPQHGKAHLSGTLSLAARHPIRWAVEAGATRLDMSEVSVLDSSGIGLLLQTNARHGVTIEKCSAQVCRLVRLCGVATVCADDCRQASVALSRVG